MKSYSPKQFSLAFGPNLQVCMMSVKSIAVLSGIDGCPTLTDVTAAYGIELTVDWLKCQLLKVNDFVGVQHKLTDTQLCDLSMQIACQYHFLNIAEMCCFFGRLRSGRYEDFYGSVDPMRILKSLVSFCLERGEDIERMNRQRENIRRAEHQRLEASQVVSREEYLKNRNQMMKVTIYWKTRDKSKIRRIRERFGISDYVSVNGETPAEIKDEDIEVLRETEKRGFIQLRFKPQ